MLQLLYSKIVFYFWADIAIHDPHSVIRQRNRWSGQRSAVAVTRTRNIRLCTLSWALVRKWWRLRRRPILCKSSTSGSVFALNSISTWSAASTSWASATGTTTPSDILIFRSMALATDWRGRLESSPKGRGFVIRHSLAEHDQKDQSKKNTEKCFRVNYWKMLSFVESDVLKQRFDPIWIAIDQLSNRIWLPEFKPAEARNTISERFWVKWKLVNQGIFKIMRATILLWLIQVVLTENNATVLCIIGSGQALSSPWDTLALHYFLFSIIFSLLGFSTQFLYRYLRVNRSVKNCFNRLRNQNPHFCEAESQS